jgi:hypothetical protein
MIFFFKLTFYVSLPSDLCAKLKDKGEHDYAGSWRFSEAGY